MGLLNWLNGRPTEFANDVEAWQGCNKRDRWIYDKLLLSQHFGYRCGPAGVPPEKSGYYIVRPITNLHDMGAGASLRLLQAGEEPDIPPGYFWCEQFQGPQYSVDYVNRKPVLTLLAYHRNRAQNLYQFDRWKRVQHYIPFPRIPIRGNYTYINVEYVGDKPIEIHLRNNPDLHGEDFSEFLVVWDGDSYDHANMVHLGYEYVDSPADGGGLLPIKRWGFYKK